MCLLPWRVIGPWIKAPFGTALLYLQPTPGCCNLMAHTVPPGPRTVVLQWSYDGDPSRDRADFIYGAAPFKPANCTRSPLGAIRYMYNPPRDGGLSFGCWHPMIDYMVGIRLANSGRVWEAVELWRHGPRGAMAHMQDEASQMRRADHLRCYCQVLMRNKSIVPTQCAPNPNPHRRKTSSRAHRIKPTCE